MWCCSCAGCIYLSLKLHVYHCWIKVVEIWSVHCRLLQYWLTIENFMWPVLVLSASHDFVVIYSVVAVILSILTTSTRICSEKQMSRDIIYSHTEITHAIVLQITPNCSEGSSNVTVLLILLGYDSPDWMYNDFLDCWSNHWSWLQLVCT